ncbi:sporulation transcriptional regulator SpoIIID [Erwinia persicina]|nr:sporulation transcriptional regulator SpoIIID [Erwinia persicina]MBD8168666.1 sporulation transcriptional regulator SpoIIID [Erwinia persicina]
MRQKRRKAQPESTVHKDMAREEFARAFNPQVADRLRQILEASRRARGGHE